VGWGVVFFLGVCFFALGPLFDMILVRSLRDGWGLVLSSPVKIIDCMFPPLLFSQPFSFFSISCQQNLP